MSARKTTSSAPRPQRQKRVTSYTRPPKRGTPAYAWWLEERRTTFDSLAAELRIWCRSLYTAHVLDELPDEQKSVFVGGKPFDFRFRVARLFVEMDGLSYDPSEPMGHQTARGYDRDRRKDAEAMAAGWRVLRLTSAMLDDGSGWTYLERALGIHRKAA